MTWEKAIFCCSIATSNKRGEEIRIETLRQAVVWSSHLLIACLIFYIQQLILFQESVGMERTARAFRDVYNW